MLPGATYWDKVSFGATHIQSWVSSKEKREIYLYLLCIPKSWVRAHEHLERKKGERKEQNVPLCPFGPQPTVSENSVRHKKGGLRAAKSRQGLVASCLGETPQTYPPPPHKILTGTSVIHNLLFFSVLTSTIALKFSICTAPNLDLSLYPSITNLKQKNYLSNKQY